MTKLLEIFVKRKIALRRTLYVSLLGLSCFPLHAAINSTVLEKVVPISNPSDLAQKITLPKAPNGYEILLKGSDCIPVVDKSGNIHKPLTDIHVHLWLQIKDLKTGDIEDLPSQDIIIQGSYNATQEYLTPKVVPTLREWRYMPGKMHLAEKGAVVVDPKCAKEVLERAQSIVEDLRYFSHMNFTVREGYPHDGDIYLTQTDKYLSLGEEGYYFKVGDFVTIESSSANGLFMGSRTLLQMVDLYGSRIPKGEARDYPKYTHRGFMIDTGRKYFHMEFLKDYVRIMSYYKMNEFQVHLNDNGFKGFYGDDWSKTYSAFRLECDTYPGLTAKDGSYTKEEFRDLQKLGKTYGVNVIPEIDVPAHALAFTQYKPEIGSEKYGMDHLDITKKETYTFVDNLFKEYLSGDNPVFIGPDVHVGTDEYAKEAAEAFRKFTDHCLGLVENYGKNPRFWGSLTWAEGKTPVRSEGVVMNAWYNGYAEPREMIKEGYKLISTSDRHLYIVPAAGYYYDYLNLKFLYNDWEPNLVGGEVFPLGHDAIIGGMFAEWNDHTKNGISEKDVHHRVYPAMQVLADKMWHGKEYSRDLKSFESNAHRLVEAPGVNVMGKVESESPTILYYNFETSTPLADISGNSYNVQTHSQVDLKKGAHFTAHNKLTTPLKEIGYNYRVDLDAMFDKQIFDQAILAQSDHATVTVSNKGNGIQIGFSRDGYTYYFKHVLPQNKRVQFAIVGDNKGTSLYIGDQKVERLEGRVDRFKDKKGAVKKMYIQQTLVFPLKQWGAEHHGFAGNLYGVKVTSMNKPAILASK